MADIKEILLYHKIIIFLVTKEAITTADTHPIPPVLHHPTQRLSASLPGVSIYRPLPRALQGSVPKERPWEEPGGRQEAEARNVFPDPWAVVPWGWGNLCA